MSVFAEPPAAALDRIRASLDPVREAPHPPPAAHSAADSKGGAEPGSAPADEAHAPAAVLAALIEREGALHFILTERAAHLSRHAGQVAFPGGRIDPHDPSAAAAALREAHEEIALPPERVELLGSFEPMRTGTGYEIIPFVGLVHGGFEATIDPAEVADVFETPYAFLMNPANRRRASIMWEGKKRWFYEMPYEERYIWGATAGLLKTLSDRLYGDAG
jgi:8-oxo-dGTP pyrophosphatase MutT (NUDIX family)